MRRTLLVVATLSVLLVLALVAVDRWFLVLLGPVALAAAATWRDAHQPADNMLRNYPGIGRFKHFVADNRVILQQAALENPREGRPFDEIHRHLVRARADDAGLHRPFGTEYDYGRPGHQWLLQSLYPTSVDPASLRVRIGGPRCTRPYDASILNIGAMSHGSISPEAIRALAAGAAKGGFAVNTGEGGLAAEHTGAGGDVIFQFGTAYFGCRTDDGRFDAERFRACATDPRVRMVEVKISQGAKPGFGAILPASKNTADIARIRGVEAGTEVRSPAGHTAFRDAPGLVAFVARLRALADGRPVGVKLCVGRAAEWNEVCRAMVEADDGPDYFVVDGGEGGTGAGALDALHWVGMPLDAGLAVVHEGLRRHGLRHRVRVLAAGKVASGFDVVRLLALGADGVYSARAMMMALGCVQALRCDTNRCPTGITTMDLGLRAGLVVADKAERVASYHRNTVRAVADLLGAAGLSASRDVTPAHIARRMPDGSVRTLAEITPG